MKPCWTIALAGLCLLPGCAPAGEEPGTRESQQVGCPSGYCPPGYGLSWEDEFAGTTIDSSKWVNGEYPWGGHVLGSGEDYAMAENATVADGALHLKLTATPSGGKSYSGAVISSHGKKEFGLGYFELRARYQGISGLWPGLWLNHDMTLFQEEHTHEIDVLEVWGNKPDTTHQAVHFFDREDHHYQQDHDTAQPAGFCNEWHVYGLLWTATSLVWSIDGKQVWNIDLDDQNEQLPHRGAPMNLILDHAAGGWDQRGPDKSKLPADLLVDYVRYYQPPPRSSLYVPLAVGNSS